MKRFLTFIFYFICSFAQAQQIVNGTLNGEINGHSSLPIGWQAIPYYDETCIATMDGWDTPNLLSVNEPQVFKESNILGLPHSDSTFVEGSIITFNSDGIFQEGIMQEVDDFEIGKIYLINFFQTQIRPTVFPSYDKKDTCGSWAVYLDNDLIGITKLSCSTIHYSDINLQWEERTLNFKATKEHHFLKFLPYNKFSFEPNITPGIGSSMGIDDISLSSSSFVLPNIFTPNGDGINDVFTPIARIGFDSITTHIYNRWGKQVFESTNPNINWKATDTPVGIYYYKIDYFIDIKGEVYSKKGWIEVSR